MSCLQQSASMAWKAAERIKERIYRNVRVCVSIIIFKELNVFL